MATVIEFDQRYRTEREAVANIPYMGVIGWKVVGTFGESERDGYRLQLTTDRPIPVLKFLRKTFPLYTFRVIRLDGEAKSL